MNIHDSCCELYLTLISVGDVNDGKINGSSKDIELKGKDECGRL
jgi:hypothetical protein